MILKILMILTVFVNFVVAPVFSSPVFARVKNTRYSRARRTKVAGSRGGTGSGNKKAQEQNLMEDFTRFVFSSYGTTLQYGQSYNLQNMLKYSVYKYYKENGSEAELNEQFCFGPYMKLTSTVAGAGGENIDLRATNGTVCTYIKPNTNYAITLIDATDKQISDAVKKNSTPCMTSVDKRRVCITRNGQDLQTMHLTSAIYLDTKPYIEKLSELIGKVQTSCGEFAKQMADINDKLGLGVPLSSGFGMALSGAATAVGYMNYKATKEQDELLEKYREKLREFRDVLVNSKLEKETKNFPTEEFFKGLDWSKDVKIKEWFKKYSNQSIEEYEEYDLEGDEYRELCGRFMDVVDDDSANNNIRFIKDKITSLETGCTGALNSEVCVSFKDNIAKFRGVSYYEIEGKFTDIMNPIYNVKSEDNSKITAKRVINYIIAAGNCCTDVRTDSGSGKCKYPKARQQAKKVREGLQSETEYDEEIRKLTNLQDELKKEGDIIKNIEENHKKSRALDITTAALSGVSAVTSVASMGLSIAAIETIKKSIETVKQCKKDVRDLKTLNKEYVNKQTEADEE